MKKRFLHLTNITDIEQTLADNHLCLFFIKAPDCGVCNVMLERVGQLAEKSPSLCSFFTDIREEPLIAGHFLVYSGPTVLLLMDGKEVYRGSQFINMEELEHKINQYQNEVMDMNLSLPTDSHLGLNFSIHSFEELSIYELYEILKVRAAVFVVEQACAYQDLDDIDFQSTHITLRRDNGIVAYARVFKDEAGLWHIGRVLSAERNKRFGMEVMREAIKVATDQGAECIEIEAQCYALGFYEKFGFHVSSAEFMLDGIPHRRMRLEI